MKDKENQIEEMAKLDIEESAGFYSAFINDIRISKNNPLSTSKTIMSFDCPKNYILQAIGISKDSVVLSKEELKRLETNYKIGLGKSQSWCKSLKNRIEELEKENFKLKVDNEELKGITEQLRQEIITLSQELVNSRKETAEKFYGLVKEKIEQIEKFYFDNGKIGYNGLTVKELNELAKQIGVEIKE